MANGKKKVIEPLKEGELKKAILDLQALDAEYTVLDKRYDVLAERILATMPPKDIRQYGSLRCCIVQAWRRTVNWKHECLVLARKYLSAKEFRKFLFDLVKTYQKKPNKASIRLTIIRTEE
jgi:hypothetical protein